MTEELKIIIKAMTEEAQRKLEEVQKELNEIKKEGEKSGGGLKESFGKIAKGAAVAVGAITALTGAMVALGKSSMEFQKAQAKLNASFQAVGSSAEQATETYQNLFRFLGDTNTATEAAQSLALITTNQKHLAEWTNILQGAYSLMGDKLPTEGLAEAANETIKTGVVTGNLADALNWLGVSEDAVNEKLATMNSQMEREAFLRETLNSLYSGSAAIYERNNQAMLAHNESQAKLDQAMADASRYILPMMTQLNILAATLLQTLKPAIETVSAVIIVFCQWIAAAARLIGGLFGSAGSEGAKAGETIQKTTASVSTGLQQASNGASGLSSALNKAANNAKELKKQTMGFDELNVVSSQTSASSGGGAGGGGIGGTGSLGALDMSGIGDVASGLEDFSTKVEEIRAKMESILFLAGLVGAAIVAWKIGDFVDKLKTVEGYKESILSKAKSIGGWMLIVAGALLLVQGYSDAWVNGLDWGNFATILAGIALTITGLTLAFGAKAGAIGAVVAGISLLVLGIKDLVENGYSMEAVLAVLAGGVMVVVGAILAFNASLLASPITWIVLAIAGLVAAFVILWNECEGFRNFFIAMWEGIKSAFNAVVEWFKGAIESIGNFFSNAAKTIKNVWNGIPNFFKGIWEGIKKIFSKVGEVIGNAITNTVKKAVNAVLSVAVGIINGFISAINLAIKVINLIPGVEISKIKKLDVPKLAKGGIATRSTLANIGEAGKEAVLPLENNTGWMDILADRIAARQSAPSKIVLALDGKELGYATINSINNITRQTGTLQLAIV